MKRETENLLLLLLGVAVLVITLNGAYLRYVKAGMFGFLLVSGAAIVAVTAIAIVRDIRRGHGGPAHAHTRTPWLLLIPAAVLLLVTPAALGSGVVLTSTPIRPTTPAATDDTGRRGIPPLYSGEAPRLRLVDLVHRAAWDTSGSLDGREIRISGFVLQRRTPRPGLPDAIDMDLMRVVISCCVGDARYVYVHLTDMPRTLDDDTWIEVRGLVESGSARADPELAPTVRVLEYLPIDPPEVRYERIR